MKVNARFWVQKITKQAVSGGNHAVHVELAPVVRAKGLPGADENVDWSKYTPSGNIQMTITSEPAARFFEEALGHDIAITFERAPE